MKIQLLNGSACERPQYITWSTSWFWSGPRGEENVNKITRGKQESCFFSVSHRRHHQSVKSAAAAQHGSIEWPAARARNESEQHIQPEQGRHRRSGQDGVRAVQALASVIIIIIIVSKKRSVAVALRDQQLLPRLAALLLLVSVSAAELKQSQWTHRVVSRPPA